MAKIGGAVISSLLVTACGLAAEPRLHITNQVRVMLSADHRRAILVFADGSRRKVIVACPHEAFAPKLPAPSQQGPMLSPNGRWLLLTGMWGYDFKNADLEESPVLVYVPTARRLMLDKFDQYLGIANASSPMHWVPSRAATLIFAESRSTANVPDEPKKAIPRFNCRELSG